MLRIPDELRGRLDVSLAVEEEAQKPPDQLPFGTAELVVRGHVEEFAQLVDAKLKAGFEATPHDLLLARKSPRGLRPLSVLPMLERVVYRALVAAVAPELPLLRRSNEDWLAFNKAPLDVGNLRYVIHSDVASFYQYVDHGLLENEIVSQTGDAALASAIGLLLNGFFGGRRFGLPQGYLASDILSEAIIDIVERRMIRADYPIWRFSDDFRIGARSWPETLEAMEALDMRAREVGLTLNDGKTYPMTIEHYRDWVAAPQRIWEEIAEGVEIDLLSWSPYGEPEEPLDEEVLMGAAERVLSTWAASDEEVTTLTEIINRQLIGQALFILRHFDHAGAMPYVRRIVALEPHLTPQVSRYLASVKEVDPDAVTGELSRWIVEESALSRWQALWLFEALLNLGSLPQELSTWLADHIVRRRTDSVTAKAAIILAQHDLIDLHDLGELYEVVPPASRPDLVSAIALRAGTRTHRLVATVERETPLHRWIVEQVIAER